MNFKELSITVVGTVRNCEKSIDKEYKILKNVLLDFKSVNFFIVESDSNDSSLKKLEILKSSNEHFDFVSMGQLKSKLPKRTHRIAYCRNRYLEELNTNPKYQKTDYVVVSDLDGMNDLLTREAIISCWVIDKWDVCTANQKGKYYDIWALRHPLWSPNDCWEQFTFLNETMQLPSVMAERKAIGTRQIRVPENSEPIEVDSAFGGLGIYKKSAIGNAKYIGTKDDGEEICEHLGFHAAIRDKGSRILINPKLINCKTPKDHILNSPRENLKYVTALLFPKLYNFLQQKTRHSKQKS